MAQLGNGGVHNMENRINLSQLCALTRKLSPSILLFIHTAASGQRPEDDRMIKKLLLGPLAPILLGGGG